MDAEQLEEALSPHFPGVQVQAIEHFGPLEEINRNSRLRVNGSERVGTPEQTFAKRPPKNYASSMGYLETIFYRRLAQHFPLRVSMA